MINVKMILINGDVFNLRNMAANNVKEFIKNVLMPTGVQKPWAEIFPGEFIQTAHIMGIREMTPEEFEQINNVVELELESSEPIEEEEEK